MYTDRKEKVGLVKKKKCLRDERKIKEKEGKKR